MLGPLLENRWAEPSQAGCRRSRRARYSARCGTSKIGRQRLRRAHPGGNITGFHNYAALGAKWMGILKEIAPAVRRAAFVHVPEITANVAFMRVGEASSAALGMTVSGSRRAQRC